MKPSFPDRHPAPATGENAGSTGSGAEVHAGWAVVVPVKRWAVAKSRLAPLGALARSDLVAAMAIDTVHALAQAGSVQLVVVVTDELAMGIRVSGPKVVSIQDVHVGDLNASLVQGATEARRVRGDLPVVAVCADLPSLRAQEVDDLLAGSSGAESWFVADANGFGTSMYGASALSRFHPAFGSASRARHLAGGATELTEHSGPSLRADVDIPEDLRAVLALGVGPLTLDALTRHQLLGS